ncbi:AAA family ATPase [Trichocoleus sp. DQ-A3]|uniref:AAA family ATPase n=1 Tax=Cyanophyceae TaxID=3028117 RepID=UPI001685363D|nr:AAA family ATPase [Coleofasciculus sp. FACHB-125]MBD1903770.1 AAA family ATPase [Coleofasciculus sp. FACHB-125]
MSVIAFCAQKGGVGKTTGSVHFAVWLQRKKKKVAFLDADPQGSGSMWLSSMQLPIGIIKLSDANDLIEQIPELSEQTDYVVVDGAPNSGEATRAVLCLSDVSVTPVQPSGLDLSSTGDIVRLIKSAQKISGGLPKPAIFLNRAFKGTRLKKEALEVLNQFPDVALLKTAIHQKQAISDCFTQEGTIWDISAAKESAKEFESLFNEILKLLK